MTTIRATIAVLVMAGCGGAGSDQPPADEPQPGDSPEVTPLSDPRLPGGGERFAPSLVRLAAGEELDVDLLADVDTCRDCHADVAHQWSASAHGHSSFDDPWYRSGIEIIRDEVGARESRFCAGCHDPLLLVSGRIDDEEIDLDDPLTQAGITCMVCHGIEEVRPDGNASYTLGTRPVPIPRRGDAESLEAHRERVKPAPLREGTLCATCHRGFLGPQTGTARFLPGMDDAGPWRGSHHAGTLASLLDEPVEENDCKSCHMQREEATEDAVARGTGWVRSHRFPGGLSQLAALQDDPAQLAAVRRQLRRAATIDVAAVVTGSGERTLPADGAPVGAGDRFTVDVVVRNAGAGHRFPGGARDTHDTWIELRVTGADGRTVAEAGTRHERTREDPTAHRLITVMLDGSGRPELQHLVHRFRAKAYDHTIAPRDAKVVRYGMELPEDLSPSAFPLRVEATLRHRRHVPPMHDLACEATRSPEGRRVLATSRRLGREAIDGCRPQPVTDLTHAVVWLGRGADEREPEGGADRDTWRRMFDHSLGLLHDVQEHLDDVRPSLALALAELGEDGEPLHRAMVMALRARLEGRQGRLDDAIAWADRAEELVGPHPAIDRIRGQAYAQVWRWADAADAHGRMAQRSPGFTAGWRELAQARGSAGDDRGALLAATTGLGLQPRDGALLRSQALALEGLGHRRAAEARQAFLSHRVPDDAQDLRFTCGRDVDRCERDRQPLVLIHTRQ